ncbi:hypothetical protein O0L34_g16083 [Tuta absoluta]|nr:hypothetical protein O0L34_g16083 [Tuta absoluta]
MAVWRVFVILCLCQAAVAYTPERQADWAEPDAETYAAKCSNCQNANRQTALLRVSALRDVMEAYQVDAYIVPTADAHNSQYIAAADARREWISGLSGSSGTAVVTADKALVWTDARYFTQFFMEVDTDIWELMRQGTDLSINEWLAQNMTNASVVAVDPTTYTRSSWNTLQTRLSREGILLIAVPVNLVDLARDAVNDSAPARDNNDLIVHPVQFTGEPSIQKISKILEKINSRGATALVLTALDDIAYTLNLRGTDIPYNPVFFSYLIIRVDQVAPNNVVLFWGNGTLTPAVTEHLISEGTNIVTRPYEEIFEYLRNMSSSLPADSTIWLSDDASHAVFSALEAGGSTNLLSSLSPVVLMKCVKNEVELEGFRRAHIKDGTALVRFMRWIHEEVDVGHNVTEIDVVDKLIEFRSQEADFMGASFATIAGAGEHGAVIHYKPDRDGEQRVVRKEDMLLVDSGGHFRDGTTDTTRTRHMSTCTEAQKRAFTRVLKGNIQLGTAVFPRGIVGHRLETLARKALWDIGLDYGHGTGHGVGQFLNVHEGPSWILSGPSPTDPGVVPGMIFSNEPGYYKVGEYGVRHEDLVEVMLLNKESDHIRAAELVDDFAGVGALGFHYISLAPHQTSCIDVQLLSDFELKFLNDYHARVLETIGPILQQRNLSEDYDWLVKQCTPLTRASATDAAVRGHSKNSNSSTDSTTKSVTVYNAGKEMGDIEKRIVNELSWPTKLLLLKDYTKKHYPGADDEDKGKPDWKLEDGKHQDPAEHIAGLR